MVFQLRPQDSRESKYPNAQDANFLGYDRPSDRWKVDASGIHLYASGISVDLDKDNDSVAIWSASGTASIPVYNTSPMEVVVDIGDSIKVLSASGTPDLPVYLQSNLDFNNDSVTSRVLSASGTPTLPVYLDGGRVHVDIKKDHDSISVWSASGTSSVATYLDGSLPGGDNNIGNVDVLTMPEVEVTDVSNSVPKHDYKALTYTNSLVTGIVYKTGGSGGTTVATRTLTYDGTNKLVTDTVV